MNSLAFSRGEKEEKKKNNKKEIFISVVFGL